MPQCIASQISSTAGLYRYPPPQESESSRILGILVLGKMRPSVIGVAFLLGSSTGTTMSVVEAFTFQQLPAARNVLPVPSAHNPLPQSQQRFLHLSSTSATDADTPGATTSTTSNDEPPVLGGTQQFDSWFQSKVVGGKSQPGLKHATFQSNSLRGVQYGGSKNRGIVEVPEKVVLRTEYNRNTKDGSVDEDWDSRLAVMLVKECLKGEDSDIFG